MLQPTAEKDRIDYLDILRGIAIYCISLANIIYFTGYYFLSDEQKSSFFTYPVDRVLNMVLYGLLDGKFYSIFSILFGIGFIIQYRKLRSSNKSFVSFFLRRMVGLLVIGLIHLFVWYGDILTLYALIGFVLILYRNCSNKRLIWWAVILLIMPEVNVLLMGVENLFYPVFFFQLFGAHWSSMGLPVTEVGRPDILYLLNVEDVGEFMRIAFYTPLMRLGVILMEGRIFKVLALFLIGIWAGRKILDENLLSNRNFLKKVVFWGLLFGIPFNALRVYFEFVASEANWIFLADPIAYTLGVAPLAFAYAALFALWYGAGSRMLKVFGPVGRMALSNYVFQTIISISIYYGIGLGMGGEWGYSRIILTTTFIYALQLLFSTWWLKTYKYGPLEWIWRKMTYGKFITKRSGSVSIP